jgi:hypothetical protein
MNIRRLWSAILCMLIPICICQFALSQSITDGAIAGTVVDPTGYAVGACHVALHNLLTNAQSELTANGQGYFRATALQPGQYSVTITAPGFSTYVVQSVTVQVGAITELTPILRAGATSESVNVSGATPMEDVESPAIASYVGQVSISNLPINGRRWSDFVILTPGAIKDSGGQGLTSFRGTSSLLNNISIDGADNNQALFSEERGRSLRVGYSTAQAAVEEFQVNTSNYSAEYGRSAGGVVNTITKSGTNQYHGELYFFDRDNNWGATNPFTKLTSVVNGVYTSNSYKPKDWRKQTGIAIGGPILHNRLFFFYSFDYYFHNFPGVAVAGNPANFFAAPTSAQVAILAQRLNIGTAAALQNYNNGLTGLASLLGPSPRSGEQYINFPKLDWQINQANRATFEVNRMRWDFPGGVVGTAPTNTSSIQESGNDYSKVTWGVARLSTILSPSTYNWVLFQYGRDFEYEYSKTPSPYEAGIINPQLNQPPTVSVFGGSGFSFGTSFLLPRNAYPDEHRTQVADTVTLERGRHTIAVGFDYNHVNDYTNTLISSPGQYTYSNVLNYLSDYYTYKSGLGGSCNASGTGAGAYPCYSAFSQATGPKTFSLSSNDYAVFINDDLKLRPNLTITAGIRYEYEQNAGPIASLNNPGLPQTNNIPHDWNNFGPRIGFSYKPLKTATFTIRGGYGLYYGRVINGLIGVVREGTGAATSQTSFTYVPTVAGAPTFPNVFTTSPSTGLHTAYFLQKNLQNPQVHQLDLAVEQQVGWGSVFSLSYLGSLGRELSSSFDTNIDTVNTTPITYNIVDPHGVGPIHTASYSTTFYSKRLNPSYGQIDELCSCVNSSYNALVAEIRHAMNHHLQFDANYTWSHALDYGQNGQTGTLSNQVLNPQNIHSEYGNSLFNTPQRLVASAVIEAPWHVDGWKGRLLDGFTLAPILQAQSGFQYTLQTVGTPNVVTSTGAIISALGGTINGSNGANRIDVVGRNTYRTPGTINLDLRLAKTIPIHEGVSVELLADAFNLANHQNVTAVLASGYQITGTTTPNGPNTLTFYNQENGLPNLGTVTATGGNLNFNPRQVELAARIHF